ncbi:hypothetical protein C0Q70_05750 [Pomacea canaliculata]|uniref:CARD domain-containing protein n=1 Tax=Pomacea canaliculata TaxID=400727 RepID=A0A2T7PM22_POMCA|nr:hypothetical protein C0Q70_05750 [Pomacea canaliculata]
MASERTEAAEGVEAIKRDNNNRSADDLYIRNDHELQDFWRAILPAFVRTVDPRESGLMDQLFAEDMLSESDVESLCGKHVVTRRDQARKLAVSLMKYRWNEFMTMVAPALCTAKYTHIIPCKYWITNDDQRTEMTSLRGNGMTTTELCLRHIIKHRLRPAALADMLFHRHYMSFEEYRMFISEETSSNSDKWTKIFSTLSKPPSPQAAKETESDLRQRLSRHINVPDSLSDILLRGLPCCCKERSRENSRGKV